MFALLVASLLAAGPSVAADPDVPPTEPKVLQEWRTSRGLVRVTDHGARRVLSIDGVVQGAAAQGSAPTGDPLVALLLAAHPKAQRALVLGLGTGRTVGELRARGVLTVAVEIEPAVVEAARVHFGYSGQVAVADAVEYVRSATAKFDLVVLDTCDRPGCTPPPGIGPLLRARLQPGGVVGVRGLGAPDAVQGLAGDLRLPGVAAFGSGVGEEAQNLFLLLADRSLEVRGVPGLAAWPLAVPSGYGQLDLFPKSWLGSPVGSVGERRVELLGYLVRYPGAGLVLDLPHEEMGAVRYLLQGPRLAELERLLPAQGAFPTQGDLSTDGSLTATVHPVLGGGGVLRSDMRASPVAVRLTGTARFLRAADPDAWVRRGGTREDRDPLLPHGGALYELTVDQVLGKLDRAGWRAADKALVARLAAAKARLVRGDLPGAAAALTKAETGLREALTGLGLHVPLVEEVGRARQRLAEAAAELSPKPTDFDVARACDRLSWPAEHVFGFLHPALQDVRESVTECAVARYQQVARSQDGHARTAAGRLLWLLAEDDPRRANLEKRFGKGLERQEDPP